MEHISFTAKIESVGGEKVSQEIVADIMGQNSSLSNWYNNENIRKYMASGKTYGNGDTEVKRLAKPYYGFTSEV
jgi:hypothetical protein